jgi:hypothetical protein
MYIDISMLVRTEAVNVPRKLLRGDGVSIDSRGAYVGTVVPLRPWPLALFRQARSPQASAMHFTAPVLGGNLPRRLGANSGRDPASSSSFNLWGR